MKFKPQPAKGIGRMTSAGDPLDRISTNKDPLERSIDQAKKKKKKKRKKRSTPRY